MSFADRNRAHDSLHHLINLGESLSLDLVPDISCTICYPIDETFEYPENFDDFWSWYRLQFKATQYSRQTVELFVELKTSISELAEQTEDWNIFLTVATQAAALLESCRYQPSVNLSKDNAYQSILDLILVLSRTNHIETGSSPFLEWTKAFIEQQDILLTEQLQSVIVDPSEATTSSSLKTANTRTHRSGGKYNQDPAAKYKKRSYKPFTKTVIAQAQKALETSSSVGYQSTQSTPLIQTSQIASEDSDETDDTITQFDLNTIPEDSENSEDSGISETTTNYTEANEDFSPSNEQRRREIANLTVQQEEAEYPPLEIPDHLSSPEPIYYYQKPPVLPLNLSNLTTEQAEEASQIVLGT